MTGPTRIVIQPDAPAVLAQRLVRRLHHDGLVFRGAEKVASTPLGRAHLDLLTEVLADEIHQAAVDGTIGGGA